MPVPQSDWAPEVSSARCGSIDGERRRQLGAGQVVVGDDHADAGRPRRAHRVHAR